MSKIQTEKLIKHLQAKWGTRPCPMCNARQWNVQETAFELREFHGGDFVLGASRIIPVVPVVCRNCGNTILVNSLVAGVVIEEPEKGDTNE